MELQNLYNSQGQFIDGAWRPGSESASDMINPATEISLGEMKPAGAAQVIEAIAAAYAARASMRALTAWSRSALLRRAATLIHERAETLGRLVALETGKPIRHRYFGVLAPNSPLRAAVTALAQPAASQPATVETAQPGAGVPGVAAPGNAATPTPEPEARPKRAAHYLWAVLIARIYEAFPLLCPMCGGQMRIIAFITHSAEIRHILNHIGVESAPPHITPARGPPLWEGCDAPVDDGAQGEPDWDLAAQPDEVDQRVNW